MKQAILYACGILFMAALATTSRAQVWIDATQIGDKTPDWIGAKLYKPTPQPHVERVWVEPVYRTVCKQVWREPVSRVIAEQTWVDGHYETRMITTSDGPCGCPSTREERVWIAGHTVVTHREVCVTPGRWETIEFRECVTPGHFEEVTWRE